MIGSGPSGLTCAGDLAKKGYDVTVFEALHTAGGVLVYGIPEFRLPKAIVQKEIDTLQGAGRGGARPTWSSARSCPWTSCCEQGYEAVFIGSGAGLPRFMNIPGENLKGVYSANEFLTRVNLMKAYQPGSDTPVEHAQARGGGGRRQRGHGRRPLRACAWGRRKCLIVYRRSEKELPARARGSGARQGGGHRVPPAQQPRADPGGRERQCHGPWSCVKMELGEPDASGRRRPVAGPGQRVRAWTWTA